jgi:predicted nucleic acid-binding protein
LKAIDTNILIYATEEDGSFRHRRAGALFKAAIEEGTIVPLQVLGEYLAVISRKKPALRPAAESVVIGVRTVCATPVTTADDLTTAFSLAARHRLQYFDALILTVAARAGATTLYSEDMQDGFRIGDLTVVNPFKSLLATP